MNFKGLQKKEYDLIECTFGLGGTSDGEETDIYHFSFEIMNSILKC